MKYRIIKKYNWWDKDFWFFSQVRKSFLKIKYWKNIGFHYNYPESISWCEEDILKYKNKIKYKKLPIEIIKEYED